MSNQFGHNRDGQRVAAARAVARQLGDPVGNAALVRQRQMTGWPGLALVRLASGSPVAHCSRLRLRLAIAALA